MDEKRETWMGWLSMAIWQIQNPRPALQVPHPYPIVRSSKIKQFIL